jgi:hypothetical protein
VVKLAAVQTHGNEEDRQKLKEAFAKSARAYEEARTKEDFWKQCMGKQVAAAISTRLGFKGPEFMEKAVLQMWNDGTINAPNEVIELRSYVTSLS